ncbi:MULTISPECIES: ExbD/TolR family protein [Ectothiorhodospira]|uniref:ExbD/TolR family protein n=1 Tax=Ectothiorhodospira TaxID=1051 RepID=UPI00047DD137|nr:MULTISPECIES: biopolymer transporter ExbD [Ectothiorhodospira]MCG5493861.1 biopolymer transporter ExbD [Ectothiorhodospira variabilis]MCG5497952.1 biopolymer transporter ExbD [Ectothiorhodospira variabilis]MCG5503664.1 biopolymer transporter ExbD [Ectothiorhodospira variabilis]MCG5506820.1 biopolymer transporter ExbD [Ectothiorhodospira variabilis]MCG5524732.1 biopolymer transporter ExbD [Ectothiorhodospira haloalkaliphila]
MHLPEFPQREADENHLIPLINIVFLLLIFFMVAGALSSQDVFDVEAPDSSIEEEVNDEGWLVLLGEGGRLAFENEELESEALKARLVEALDASEGDETSPQPAVRIKADQAATTEELLDLMELLRDAGVEKVMLLTVLGDH